MILDSSAIMAVLLREPEKDAMNEAMADAARCAVSAGTIIELAAVLVRRNLDVQPELDRLFTRLAVTIEPVTPHQAQLGAACYRKFGIGSGHRARLNFGDCFAYALATATGEPLLFKGDDFIHTDVPRV